MADLGIRGGLFDLGDGRFRFGCRARGEVDVVGVVLGELEAGFFAQTGVPWRCSVSKLEEKGGGYGICTSCDDDDFAR